MLIKASSYDLPQLDAFWFELLLRFDRSILLPVIALLVFLESP